MRARSRLRLADVGPLSLLGLRGRPVRAVLSATGVAIGVATLVAVIGISSSSRAQLIAQIDALGTNLLTVTPNQGFSGQTVTLPDPAPAMISRIGPVLSEAATASLADQVYRSDRIPTVDSQAITVEAADVSLLSTVEAHLWAGAFLNDATARLPAVVLGHDAAAALGVDRSDGRVTVWLDNRWFDVVGILDPVALAPGSTARRSSGSPWPEVCCARRPRRRRSTSAPIPTAWRWWRPCSRPRPIRLHPRTWRSPTPRTRSLHAPTPARRSKASSWHSV